MNRKKLFLIIAIVAIVGVFLGFDGHKLLTLENLQAHQGALAEWVDQNLFVAVAGYAAIYVVVAALSLPGAAIMTLAGGAFFGNLYGLAAVSIASTLGALLNVNDEYRLSSFAGIYTPIFILIGIYFFSDQFKNTILAWGTTLGAFASCAYLLIVAKKKNLIVLGKPDYQNSNIKIAFKQLPAKISSGLLTALNSV
ncbi:MAG: lipid II flippase MurJ, partial [Marinobacter sp.]